MLNQTLIVLVQFFCSKYTKVVVVDRFFDSFMTQLRWSLVVVDRWSLFRGRFSTKIAWAGFRVVVVDRWSLIGGGR